MRLSLLQEGRTREVEWPPATIALLICDVWERHWCASACRRVDELAPAIESAVSAARQQDMLIVHAPSNCMPAYEGHPARQRALDAPHATPRSPLTTDMRFGTSWAYRSSGEPALPIDDSDGGKY